MLFLGFGPFRTNLLAYTAYLATPDDLLPPSPACIGLVNVSLQDACQATISVEKALLGLPADADPATFELLVKDGYPDNGAVVDGCGQYEYTVSGPDGFSCWGYVYAEDKTAPLITCPPTATAFADRAFVCRDLDSVLLRGSWQYTTDRNGNVLAISDELKEILDITGYPAVSDNCGDLTITISDTVYEPDNRCEPVVITRTFVVRDACKGLTAGCSQEIILGVADGELATAPNADVAIPCEKEIRLDVNGNPHPDESGYPTYHTAFGQYDIDQTICNLGASYQDGERIYTCESTYKFVRHWTVLDWCNPGLEYTYTQIIKVGDFTGPLVECPELDPDHDGQADPLIFSSGPYDCMAAFLAPLPVVSDNCSSWKVFTEVLVGGTDGEVIATIKDGKPRYISGIPLGCHTFRFTVTDACGNQSITHCPFFVEDQMAPIAICNDDLRISLGGKGYARVAAAEIDEGSHDNCGPVRVEVRRRIRDIAAYECMDLFDLDGNGVILNDEVRLSLEFGDPDNDGFIDVYYYTQWEDFVDFTCCDMNENVRIELRVWDDRNQNGQAGDEISHVDCFNYADRILADNYNVCWLDVLIEDKIMPRCIAPAPVAINCDELPYNFDPQDELQMGTLFGFAEGDDNCPNWVVSELDALTEGLNDCGSGAFVRRFQVVDAKGLQSAVCDQLITIHQIHDYWIRFPADAEANCGTPLADTVTVLEAACDLLAISVKEEIFSASGDECYKLFRTYSVINWCEYDGESDPVVVSRDEDCDGVPGDEAVYVIVTTFQEEEPCADEYGQAPAGFYQHVWYDRDNDPFNTEPKAGTKAESCEYETNPTGFWKEVAPITENELIDQDGYPASGRLHCEIASTGYWQYTQVIKVYDTVDPVVIFSTPAPFCSFSTDLDAGCPAAADIYFQIQENCTPDDLTITVGFDAYQDGLIDADISEQLSGVYPDYHLSGAFPLGLHHAVISVSDGCGNRILARLPFEIVDCKAPTPTCINGLAIELMPVIPAADADGDGDEDAAAMTIWATDFIASPAVDCSGEVTYSINRSGEANYPDMTSLVLTCDDPGTVLIQIWAYDEAGSSDVCETYLFVQNNLGQCALETGAIAGTILTEDFLPVEAVQVGLSGQQITGMMTPADGHYQFGTLEGGFDYTLTPQKETDPTNGVSTFDLVIMSKHILGLQALDSPYKMIAADINNDRRITAMDAIALRRLILNIDLDFPNNSSWRFVPRDYRFPLPADPWAAYFPEVININELTGEMGGQDFVSVKVGDLNGNARANAHQGGARQIAGRFDLHVQDQELVAGNYYRIELRAAGLPDIQGFQATLSLAPDQLEVVEILDGVLRQENFGIRYLSEGALTISWHETPGTANFDVDALLFTVLVRARMATKLSHGLGLNSRYTKAEAYDRYDAQLELGLAFDRPGLPANGFQVDQNEPNPFRRETSISFYLPTPGEVLLQVYEANGRPLRSVSRYYSYGRHKIILRAADLQTSGLLYYTLTSGDQSVSRKMVLIE